MTNEEFIKSITLDGEEWRDVVGYENLYMVSSYGRIVSKLRIVPFCYGKRTLQPYLLKPHVHKTGYCRVILCNGKSQKHFLVHQIVATAFIQNPMHKTMIDHIDRNKQNNNVANLRWCTHFENMNNPLTIEHCRKLNIGRKYPNNASPVVAIKDGIVIKQYESIKEATLDGFKGSSISNVCAKRNKTHYGYNWMYLHDYQNLVNQNVKELSQIQ